MIKDVCYANGTYQDQNGQQKTRWVKCGVIVVNEQTGSETLLLEFLPANPQADQRGGCAVMLNVFEQRPRENRPSQSHGAGRSAHGQGHGSGRWPSAGPGGPQSQPGAQEFDRGRELYGNGPSDDVPNF